MTTTRTVRRPDGVELVVDEAGPSDGPAVVLAHGFPELAYSWRHQVPALAEAGFHVLAPDQRGYGRSSRPEPVDAYDIVRLTDDLVAVLDETGQEQGTFVGHDWGAMVVWALALRYPERCRGVAALSVPFMRRSRNLPTEAMRKRFAGMFFYMLFFQEPGVADADLGADVDRTMRSMLAGLDGGGADAFADDERGFVERLPVPTELPAWIGEPEVRHYVETFTRSGFTGGLNWYRNQDRNWTLMEPHHDQHVVVPATLIGGAADPVLAITPPSVQDGWLDDDRGVTVIPAVGHWVQQEAPAEVNAALLEFLSGL